MFYLTTHSTLSFSDGRKEILYLMMYSTHFYLQLYSVRRRVKNHSDERENLLLPLQGLLFMINNTGSFLCTDRTVYTMVFVTSVDFVSMTQQMFINDNKHQI